MLYPAHFTITSPQGELWSMSMDVSWENKEALLNWLKSLDIPLPLIAILFFKLSAAIKQIEQVSNPDEIFVAGESDGWQLQIKVSKPA
jgi:hypothetical protein